MIYLDQQRYFSYETMGEFCSCGTWIHPSRKLSFHDLIFMLEGELYIEEDGIPYTVFPNQAIILEANHAHRGLCETDKTVHMYWMHFKTNMPVPCKLYQDKESYNIKFLLRKLLHIANTPTYPQYASDAAALLIFEDLSNTPALIPGSAHALTAKITEYIRMNIHLPLTIASIASYFGYHPDHISKIFKKCCGKGLKEYIADKRMDYIKGLLLTTNLSIKHIAAETGFSQENALIKFFIYHENLSPARFRHQYYNTHMNQK